MCAPAAVAVGMGVLSMVSGIQNQNKEHQAQVDAVNRSNAMAKQRYVNQVAINKHNDQQKGRVFEAQLKADTIARTNYHKQKDINAAEAARAGISEQLKLEEKVIKAQFESQEGLIKAIQAQGAAAAGETLGQSYELELAQAEREFGFEQAQIDACLFSANRDFAIAQYGIDLDRYSSDTNAWNNLPSAPLAPQASMGPTSPMFEGAPKKPSILGPILQGISGGLSTYSGLGGEGFSNTPTPNLKPDPNT